VNSIDDRIRAATRARAQTLREVRPLSLPPAPGAPAARRARRGRRARAWLAPAAAALCVLAVGISLVLVKDIPNDSGVTSPQPAPSDSVPRYYVALVQQPHTEDPPIDNAVIGDTLTGKTLATIKPPAGGNLIGVSGAANDRTFVVEAQDLGSYACTWSLLRITPGTARGYGLTRLPLGDVCASEIMGISLSDSGSELAVVVMPKPGGVVTPGTEPVLRIYSVASGRLLHEWRVNVGNLGNLSWADDDRELAFSTTLSDDSPDESAMRLLNVTAPGANVLADSRVAWSPGSKASSGSPMILGWAPRLSADGTTVVYPATAGKDRHTLRWLAYSVSDPAKARVLYQVTVPSADSTMSGISWVSPSGSTLIIDWAATPTATITPAESHVGVVRDGTFTRLTLPASVTGLGLPIFAW
jgi:hypothetical protein